MSYESEEEQSFLPERPYILPQPDPYVGAGMGASGGIVATSIAFCEHMTSAADLGVEAVIGVGVGLGGYMAVSGLAKIIKSKLAMRSFDREYSTGEWLLTNYGDGGSDADPLV